MASMLLGMLAGHPHQPQRSQGGGIGDLISGLLGAGRQPEPAQRAAPSGGFLDLDGDGSSMDDIFKLVMQSLR